jgi:hypothetical protein
MTPKQGAARLILKNLDGGKAPALMDAAEMTAELSSRISEQKREKILEFVGKIMDPFRERLTKLTGEGQAEAKA